MKLDELIRAVKGARNEFMELEDLDEKELDKIREEYIKLAEKAKQIRERR